MIVALQRGAKQRQLRIVELDRHVRPFAFREPANPGPSPTRAPDRSYRRGEGSSGRLSVCGRRHTCSVSNESQSFLGVRTFFVERELSDLSLTSGPRHSRSLPRGVSNPCFRRERAIRRPPTERA